MLRYLAVLAGLVLAGVAIWHPAPHPSQAAIAASMPASGAAPAVRSTRRRHSLAVDSGVVYVVGAVVRPGLYRIGPRSRIDDAVREAGGLRADADPAGVDLAARPADGDEIDVPRLGETSRRSAEMHRTRGRGRSRKKPPPPDPLDLNASDADALASIPGIGASIAARIVAVREREGAYDSLDELLDVAGMSPSRLAKATPYLRI